MLHVKLLLMLQMLFPSHLPLLQRLRLLLGFLASLSLVSTPLCAPGLLLCQECGKVDTKSKDAQKGKKKRKRRAMRREKALHGLILPQKLSSRKKILHHQLVLWKYVS